MVKLTEPYYAKPVSKYTGSDNPRADFLDHLRQEGFKPDNMIRIGEIVRLPDKEDTGTKRTGWYKYHEIEDKHTEGHWIGVASYNSWRSGETNKKWTSKNFHFMNHIEREEFNRVVAEISAEAERERAIYQNERAKYAAEIYEASKPIKETEYTKRKKIQRDDFRVANDGRLIVAAYINDKISSLQFIKDNGEKRFLSGARMQGAWHYLDGNTKDIYICEGYATGCTIQSITGKAVYVAFNAGNLISVTNTVKERHPDANIIIAGDDDIGNEINAGRKTAIAASEVCAVNVVFPLVPTDFNDMYCAVGHEETKNALLIETKTAQKYIAPKSPETVIGEINTLEPPGILLDIVRYYNASARVQQPKFAVQTALAVGSIICARNYATQQDNRTSLYFLNIAPSSHGKEHANTIISNILKGAGYSNWEAGSGYTSKNAVFTTLQALPKHISIIDEFGRYMSLSNSAGGAHVKDSFSALMTIFGRLNKDYRQQNYSGIRLKRSEINEMAKAKIINPAITIVAMTQPESLSDSISVESIKDGYLPRFLIAQGDDCLTPPNIRREPVEVPQKILDWANHVVKRVDGDICLAEEEPKLCVLGITDDATDLFQKFSDEIWYLQSDLRNFRIEAVVGKMNEIAMRIALICALARNPEAEYVETQDAKWGIAYAKQAMDQAIIYCKRFISGSNYEKQKKEILDAIRTSGEVKESDFAKRPPFSKYKPKEREEILQDLMKAGLLDCVREAKKSRGRPSTIYFAISQKNSVDSDDEFCNSANQIEEGDEKK